MAAVWATAATLIAGFSLYVAYDTRRDRDDAVTGAQRQILRLGRTLDSRLDGFESRLRAMPRAADLKRLEGRLDRTERRAAGADDSARKARATAGGLERRVEALGRRRRARGAR